MPPPKSAIARLFDFFHTHPRGRLYEWIFFTLIGLILAGIGYYFYKRGDLAEPLYWLLLVVAACFVGFGLLPQKKGKAPPPSPLKGKRGEIAAQRKKHKHVKRGPPPPIK